MKAPPINQPIQKQTPNKESPQKNTQTRFKKLMEEEETSLVEGIVPTPIESRQTDIGEVDFPQKVDSLSQLSSNLCAKISHMEKNGITNTTLQTSITLDHHTVPVIIALTKYDTYPFGYQMNISTTTMGCEFFSINLPSLLQNMKLALPKIEVVAHAPMLMTQEVQDEYDRMKKNKSINRKAVIPSRSSRE